MQIDPRMLLQSYRGRQPMPATDAEPLNQNIYASQPPPMQPPPPPMPQQMQPPVQQRGPVKNQKPPHSRNGQTGALQGQQAMPPPPPPPQPAPESAPTGLIDRLYQERLTNQPMVTPPGAMNRVPTTRRTY